MNREFDKEIDALLRRNTRTAVRGRAGDDEPSSPSSSHLDADELSAFAEQALPAAARSLYVAHIADCAECRRAVAGLASAAGVSLESERKAAAHIKETKTESAWRVWMNALFSPRVMTYAVPALALCLVGAIAFVALRSRSENAASVAQKDSGEKSGPVSIKQEAPPTTTGEGLTEGANQNLKAAENTQSNSSVQTPAPSQLPEEQAEGAATLKDAPVGVPAEMSPGTMAAPPPAPPPVVASDVSEAVGVVGGAAPAPKTVSNAAIEKSKTTDEQARESKSENNFSFEQNQNQQAASRAAPRKVEIDQMPDGSRDAKRSDSNDAISRANNNFPVLGRQQQRGESERGAGATPMRRAPEARARRDAGPPADAEVRGVSGHKFRRQGGAWVDVNYSTSLPMTGVRRNSDGYRALVADLPEIGRIAAQLQGEVIIVVKGRAYRVR